jgi:quercetin dioxygenase-like cupin family protein
VSAGLHTPAFVRRRDEGEAFWFSESLVTVMATAESTNGGLGVMHIHAPIGAGSPVHTHLDEDESWYVLEGEIQFWLGDEERRAGQGDFVFGPRGIPHRFSVASSEARFLMLVNAGGFEGFIRSTGWPAASRTLPPNELLPHPPEQIAAAVQAHRLLIEHTSGDTPS